MKIERAFISSRAKPEPVAALRKVFAGRCAAFCKFYERSDGLELKLEPKYSSDDLLEQLDCLRLDEAEFILKMIPQNANYFPGVLVVGSDAATNRFAFDLRVSGEPPFIVFQADEEPYLHTAKMISPSFEEFLSRPDVARVLNQAEQDAGGNGLSPAPQRGR